MFRVFNGKQFIVRNLFSRRKLKSKLSQIKLIKQDLFDVWCGFHINRSYRTQFHAIMFIAEQVQEKKYNILLSVNLSDCQ